MSIAIPVRVARVVSEVEVTGHAGHEGQEFEMIPDPVAMMMPPGFMAGRSDVGGTLHGFVVVRANVSAPLVVSSVMGLGSTGQQHRATEGNRPERPDSACR